MKNLVLLSVMGIALMGSTSVSANYGGGFKGNIETVVSTVAEVKAMPDDKFVVLEGVIEGQIRGDKYQFQDESGTIIVEIDDDDWNGITVEPTDTVQIKGEVDKNFFKDTEIDVDSIQLI